MRQEGEGVAEGVEEVLMEEELPPGAENVLRGASQGLNRPDLQLSGETSSIDQLLSLTDESEH